MRTAMVVHESWLMREIIKEELAACDCQVVCEASSRLEATIAYRLHKPDIVFVDAHLQGSNGHRAITDLLDKNPRATVIALVNPAGDEAALHAVLAGARGFLVASSAPEILQNQIKRLMQASSAKPGLATALMGREYDVARPFRTAMRLLPAWTFRWRPSRAE